MTQIFGSKHNCVGGEPHPIALVSDDVKAEDLIIWWHRHNLGLDKSEVVELTSHYSSDQLSTMKKREWHVRGKYPLDRQTYEIVYSLTHVEDWQGQQF